MDYFVMGCVPDGKSGHQILRCPEKKVAFGLESSQNSNVDLKLKRIQKYYCELILQQDFKIDNQNSDFSKITYHLT